MGEDGQPSGDITVWDEILFPFDPALADTRSLETLPVEPLRSRVDPADRGALCLRRGGRGDGDDPQSDVALRARIQAGPLERKDRGRDAGGAQARRAKLRHEIVRESLRSGAAAVRGDAAFPDTSSVALTLNKVHGEFVLDNGASSASETDHAGRACGHAHRCALAFFLRREAAWRLCADAKLQRRGGGASVDTIAPILRPGVLFDIAGLMGVDALASDFVMTPEHLAACGVEPREGRRRADSHGLGAILERCGSVHHGRQRVAVVGSRADGAGGASG